MMIIISITFKICIAVQFSVITVPVYLEVRLWQEVKPPDFTGESRALLITETGHSEI